MGGKIDAIVTSIILSCKGGVNNITVQTSHVVKGFEGENSQKMSLHNKRVSDTLAEAERTSDDERTH